MIRLLVQLALRFRLQVLALAFALAAPEIVTSVGSSNQ